EEVETSSCSSQSPRVRQQSEELFCEKTFESLSSVDMRGDFTLLLLLLTPVTAASDWLRDLPESAPSSRLSSSPSVCVIWCSGKPRRVVRRRCITCSDFSLASVLTTFLEDSAIDGGCMEESAWSWLLFAFLRSRR